MHEERAELPCKGYNGDDDDALLEPGLSLKGRYVHIDVTRICCITCIVLNAFDGRYREWNALYAQNWVLQLLWLVVGICFALSQRSLAQYVSRLVLYFAIGVSVNWAAYMINGWNWMQNFWQVVAQMVFVLCLVCFALILTPLKAHLIRLAERPVDTLNSDPEGALASSHGRSHTITLDGRLLRGLLLLLAGILFIVIIFTLLLTPLFRHWAHSMASHGVTFNIDQLQDINTASGFGSSLCQYFQTIAIGLYIVVVYPQVFSDLTLITWLLLLNFYIHRLIYGYGTADFPFHGFYLMMLALTACTLGMAWRRPIAKFVQRYWMVVIFSCAFLWTPGLYGQLGVQPPDDVYNRERYILIEGVLLVAWLTAGQLMIDPKIFTEDNLSWVNEWALLSFLIHQAAKWIIPSSLGWTLLVALGPVCYFSRKITFW